MRTIKNNCSVIVLSLFLIFLSIMIIMYELCETDTEENITVQNEIPLETITVSNNDIPNIDMIKLQNEINICDEDIRNANISEKETFMTTIDMSHYTNETGKHVPSYEGGSVDRKGNALVAYESIAIPKSLYKHFPYGSSIKIVTPNGEVHYGKAVDTGSALNRLNRIDRCVSSYKEAQSLGVIKDVKIYKID